MEDNATYLTAAGKRKLEEELAYLRTVRRSEVAQHINEAKDGGDISENAGYESAKHEQAFVEGRIRTLEALLSRAQVIETPRARGEVSLGSTVVVVEEGGKPEEYLIVGPPESDPSAGRISDQSPLGRSLLGREAGDCVLVRAPGGTREFKIVQVS
jgi:transcription elongation factor GreA